MDKYENNISKTNDDSITIAKALISLVKKYFILSTVKYPDVAVRLVGGSTPNEGRVQVRYKGVWGSILIKKNSRYYLNEAHNVICRMLGYKKVNIKWKVPNSVGPRLLTGLACNGREKTIEQCRHNPWGYVRISSSNPLKEFYIRCQ